MPSALYDALGVEQTASSEEIKNAYRQKSKICHPNNPRVDKNDTKLQQMWADISTAYIILMDPDARRRYDANGDINSPKLQRESRSIAIILDCFGKAIAEIENDFVEYADLVAQARVYLLDKKGKMEQNRADTQRLLEKYLKAKGRLVMTNETRDGNPLGTFMQQQTDDMQEGIDKIKEVLLDLTMANEMLGDYRYDYIRPHVHGGPASTTTEVLGVTDRRYIQALMGRGQR